jgi:hypothetical protein
MVPLAAKVQSPGELFKNTCGEARSVETLMVEGPLSPLFTGASGILTGSQG